MAHAGTRARAARSAVASSPSPPRPPRRTRGRRAPSPRRTRASGRRAQRCPIRHHGGGSGVQQLRTRGAPALDRRDLLRFSRAPSVRCPCGARGCKSSTSLRQTQVRLEPRATKTVTAKPRHYATTRTYADQRRAFSTSVSASSKIRTAVSACSRVSTSGGEKRIEFFPAPSTSSPRCERRVDDRVALLGRALLGRDDRARARRQSSARGRARRRSAGASRPATSGRP